MEKIKVLYIGDSEIVMSRYIIGADVFEATNFNDNGHFFRDAMAKIPNIELKHINPHDVPLQYPKTMEELTTFDVIIFSDVGYNSMIFYPGLKPPYEYPLGPDRVKMVKEFVAQGGGFIMVGGYVSFSGLNAIARYHGTPIEEILPVAISPYDDRVEVTDGFTFNVIDNNHPITANIPWNAGKFTLCGYNKVTLKEGAKLLAEYNNDPFIACGEYKKGRTAIFASDFAPHWVGDFKDWEYYPHFFGQMIKWVANVPIL
ncbi:MAG: glutamine amidotransferase [Planctomycetes bacterium]|nr:glutamine amidotransferase [Planctomycetota bacterium]